MNEDKLLHAAAAAFARCETQEQLDTVYESIVKPVADEVDCKTLSMLLRMHDLRAGIIGSEKRKVNG